MLIKNQPQYLVVAETLIRDIGQDKHPIGSILPPEIELATRFGVSRNTMRAAMRVLVDMGLVSRRAGMGTTVQARAVKPNYVQAIESADQLYPGVAKTEQTLQATEDVVADDLMAMLLACAPGESWIRFETVRKQRKNLPPSSFTYVYVQPNLRALGKSLSRIKRPSYHALETLLGTRVHEVIQQADAVNLDDDMASRLGVQAGSAALRTVRRFVGEDGKIMMVTDTFARPGFEHFTIRFRANWPEAKAR